ncbi:MAG: hypothetical protein ACHQAY_23710 [Hyphomicrobiales bacterium]
MPGVEPSKTQGGFASSRATRRPAPSALRTIKEGRAQIALIRRMNGAQGKRSASIVEAGLCRPGTSAFCGT